MNKANRKLLEQSPQTMTSPQSKEALKRRNRRFYAAAIIGTLVFGHLISNSQEDSDPSLYVLPDSNQEQVIVTYSGFGGYGGEGNDLACTVGAVYDKTVISIDHGGRFDLDYTSGQLIEFAGENGIEDFRLHGTSAGGQMAIRQGADLVENHIPVSTVELVTTPIAQSDIKGYKRYLLELPYVPDILFSLSRLPIAVWQANQEQHLKTPADILKKAWDATTLTPNGVIKGQAEMLSHSVDQKDIDSLVRAGVKLRYIRPTNPNQDGTVDTIQAYNNLEAMVKEAMQKHNIPLEELAKYLELIEIGNGHAQTTHIEADLIGPNGVLGQARSLEELQAIKSLTASTDPCRESVDDVVYTAANGNYSQ